MLSYLISITWTYIGEKTSPMPIDDVKLVMVIQHPVVLHTFTSICKDFRAIGFYDSFNEVDVVTHKIYT